MKANILKRAMAFELNELYLNTKELFYSIANTPFVFAKRPGIIIVMTIVIWGSIVATYISLRNVGGINESNPLIVFVAVGIFIHLLFLGVWCGLPGNRAFWKFGKSFAKYIDKYNSERKELRRKIIQSTINNND
jgi:hypothetical protein